MGIFKKQTDETVDHKAAGKIAATDALMKSARNNPPHKDWKDDNDEPTETKKSWWK